MKKIVVTAPVGEVSDKVRQTIGEAGGGKVGNYTFCSFTTRGIGRFLPGEGAQPAIGEVGTLEQVEEERIEITCDDALVADVIAAILRVHPYKEPAIDIYALE
jgi:hypothetical protein